MRFFEPSREFINWLIGYADQRLIIDIGCGDAHLVEMVHAAGYNNIIGVDPYLQDSVYRTGILNGWHLVPMEAENFDLISDPRSLNVIARPCHNGFVARVITNSGDTETLYISKPENVDTDVPTSYRKNRLRKAPTCKEERVYSIITNQYQRRRVNEMAMLAGTSRT